MPKLFGGRKPFKPHLFYRFLRALNPKSGVLPKLGKTKRKQKYLPFQERLFTVQPLMAAKMF